ncbi:MAG: hypothetical protein H6816_12245 [Phycisphaerales bacterium]|nr:hypothetical protein [Phycisphaerales bacterium]
MTGHHKRLRQWGGALLGSIALAGTSLLLAGACTGPAGPGPEPECTVDADCPTGDVCSAAGTCVPDDTGTNGGPQPECTVDGDCPTGQVCNTNGVCELDNTGPGPGSVPDCTTNSECDAGELCTPDGVCVPEAGELPCLLDSECGPGEVCTAAGFCADANDPDPPGPSTGGGGGGGGGGNPAPDCTTNADCGVDEVCQSGLCVPAAGQPNPAEALAGCWRITFTTPGLGSSAAIYEFDADGNLERTWGIDDDTGDILEEVRFTVPNATFFNGLYGLREQVVSLDDAQTNLKISTGLISFGYTSSLDGCLILRTTICTDLALIEATLSGDPPATIVSGIFVGSRTCESTSGGANTENLYDGTVTGERLDACPDITAPQVQSQEEQGDYCF